MLHEMAAMSDNRAITALKSRALLIAYLEEDNLEAAADLTRFIEEELEEGSHTVLTPREKLLVYYRIGNHNAIFRYLNYLDTLSTRLRVTPCADDLEENLLRYFVMFRESHQSVIRCSDLPAGEQEALCIWLDYLMIHVDPAVSQDKINAACNRFLETHAGSPLELLVRRARVEWEKTAVGLDMTFGIAAFWQNGELDKYVEPSVGFSMGMAFLIKRWFAGFDVAAAPFRLKEDRRYSGNKTWARRQRATLTHLNMQTGYFLHDGKHHALAASVLLGAYSIGPSAEAIKKNKELGKAEATSFQYGAGVQYDLRLGTWRGTNREFNTCGFRFQYAFTHSTSSKRQLSGLTHKFSINYFFSVHGSRRKK
jgi:hypothetical protein